MPGVHKAWVPHPPLTGFGGAVCNFRLQKVEAKGSEKFKVIFSHRANLRTA